MRLGERKLGMHWVIDLAYMAGIVDGEGSITLYLRPKNTMRLRLQVANTNQTIMDWLQVKFGGTVTHIKMRNPAHKSENIWLVDGEKAYQVIKEIAPYLVIKQPQAKLGMEAWENRGVIPLIDRRKPMSAELIEMREKYRNEMHTLNVKGA